LLPLSCFAIVPPERRSECWRLRPVVAPGRSGPGTYRTPRGVCLFARSHPLPPMAILTVPKVLREKLGDEGAEALVSSLSQKGQSAGDDGGAF